MSWWKRKLWKLPVLVWILIALVVIGGIASAGSKKKSATTKPSATSLVVAAPAGCSGLWGELNGRAEPIGVLIEPPAGVRVSAEAMRKIPLGQMVASIREEEEAKARQRARYDHAIVPDFAKRGFKEHGRVFKDGNKRSITDTFLKEVAAVYGDAFRLGWPPRQAVAKHWTVGASTASRWASLAREAGYLKEVTQGKAGGLA